MAHALARADGRRKVDAERHEGAENNLRRVRGERGVHVEDFARRDRRETTRARVARDDADAAVGVSFVERPLEVACESAVARADFQYGQR